MISLILVSYLVVRFVIAPFKYHRRRSSQTNTYDFNSFANFKNDRNESRIASGRLFQVRGPVMANDLSQMKSAYAARGASHCQVISFLDVGQRLNDRTLPPGTLERDRAAYAYFMCLCKQVWATCTPT